LKERRSVEKEKMHVRTVSSSSLRRKRNQLEKKKENVTDSMEKGV